MLKSWPRFIAALAALFATPPMSVLSAEEPLSVPAGVGQLETAPSLVRGGVDDDGREFFVNGQPARNGKLILTASNGFFTPGVCRASGESSLPKTGDDGLIAPNYAILSNWKKTDGTIRWHLWLGRRGQVRFNVHLNVAAKVAGSKVSASFSGVTHKVETVVSGPQQAQPWNLVFDVEEPGEHTFEIAALKVANSQSGVGELYRIDVYGSAVPDSQLLRARWRPAAVHGGYASTRISQSRMWVMATRSTSNSSSYSPITTLSTRAKVEEQQAKCDLVGFRWQRDGCAGQCRPSQGATHSLSGV